MLLPPDLSIFCLFSLLRPLFFDFPEDESSASVDDQYLFGADVLVAPVLFEGARSREVYLPAGTTWSGETFEGGQRINADAPLDRIPVYLRAGAELPIFGVQATVK